MGDITTDERFSHMLKDPRFKRIPVKDKKTKIDKRFQAMFEKKDFKLKYTMDKRGRPVNHTSSEDLKKFYELSESGSESDLDEEKSSKLSKNKSKQSPMIKKNSNSMSCSKESKDDLEISENDRVSCCVENDGEGKESKLSKNKTRKSLTKKEKSSSKFHSKVGMNDLDLTDSNDLVSCQAEEKDEESELSKNGNKLPLKRKNKSISMLKPHSRKSEENLGLTDSNDFHAEKLKDKNLETSRTQLGEIDVESEDSNDGGSDDGNDGGSDEGNDHGSKDSKSDDITEERYTESDKNLETSRTQLGEIDVESEDSNDGGSDDGNDGGSDEGNDHGSKDSKSDDITEERYTESDRNLETSRTQLGEIDVESEDSTDDGSEDSDSDDETEESDTESGDKFGFDHKWQELDADAPRTGEVTRRLALCNMDWDRIEAKDILAFCNSFKGSNGVVNSVKIFPSAFGLQRMEEEKIKGPAELVEKKIESGEEDEGPEDSHYHREKLRQYQLNRLKYFYAVIDCDSVETASELYKLDGMEYESSSVILDLRYIPDDMEFNEEPHSVATEIEMSKYKSREFVNTALQQIKVNLTWDETDPKRSEIIRKSFIDPESIEDDIKNYIASSSSEDETTVDDTELTEECKKLKMEEKIAKYRSLLQLVEEKDKKDEEEYHMEFIWDPGLKEKTEKLVQEKLQQQNLTPFEEKLLKMKKDRQDNKRARKERLMKEDNSSEASANGETDDDFVPNTKMTESERHAAELALLVAEPGKESTLESTYDNTKSKKKNRKFQKKDKKIDSFKIDTQDDRFSAMYTSHLFHIDQTDPHFKNTKGVQAIFEEKQRKRKNEMGFASNISGEKQPKHMKLSSDNMNLVNSVKKKASYFQKWK